ncbi:MAG: carboxypeptidase-like regulatory domain-containing protein [Butyricimonas faecihominis]
MGQEQDYKKTRVTLNVKDMKLNDVLDTLASVAKVRFFYNHSQIDVNRKVSFDVKDRELDYVLMLALGDQPVSVEYQMNRVVVLKYQKPTQGVTIYKINGTVIDASTKEPLPGASIILKEDKGMGVVTDFDGKFFIEVPQGTSALLISFVGYEEETITVTGDMKDLEIKLTAKTTEIEDVVVTGMAPRKVESFSGGYVSVKGSELKKISPNNLLKALQVFDPSFRIVENNNAGSRRCHAGIPLAGDAARKWRWMPIAWR